MRKLTIAVTLLALAGLLYALLNTDDSDDELASPGDTRTGGDTAAAGAAGFGVPSNVQTPGSETKPPVPEPGSKPAPVRMSTTGTIIGARQGQNAQAGGQ